MKLTEHNVNGVVYHSADSFDTAGGVTHGFSTRLGGVSKGIYESMNLGMSRGDDPADVAENYRIICTTLGIDPDKVVFNRQVHGDVIRTVTSADAREGLNTQTIHEADGLMTDVPGVVLTVFTADCLPILLYDPVRRAIAAVHAGWRGTAAGIVTRAVERMSDCYGTDPADLLAAIGPGISKCCFETHEDVPNTMTEKMGACALHGIELMPTGKFLVDLKGLNMEHLENAGVLPEHIAVSDECTACSGNHKYWSHRILGEARGSQAALISLSGS